MQITVYVPKELEGTLVELAEANGQSIQQVLLSPWRGGRVKADRVLVSLDRIEGKLDSLMGDKGGRIRDFSVGGKDEQVEPEEVIDEDKELKAANERLLKKRVETKRGSVRANEAMSGFFNPQAKAGWSKKKGGK